jgi:ABC-type multidrug transport system fused ATPase/permease subunit
MTDLPDFDAAAERRGNLRTIRRVAPYLWPDGQDWAKRRVVAAMAALILAKLVTVATPFAYGAAVDALVPEDGAEPAVWLGLGAIGLTVVYGLARLMSVGFQQLRDGVFARVAQRALRRLALRDLPAYPRAVAALSHHAQDRRVVAGHRARGEGGRVPAALHAVLDHSADRRAVADRRSSSR